ncbi:MAG: asparaginase [Paenibacillus macerans]|uniref:asparaginase n=1 Tax=Paenibacillus macerans TaxID=44252 RepID=UPI00290D8D8B|nr:asparaginase [Paenibacillus macerans]MDU7477713.1 asparaginase [Paenibacillus macerans]MEC0333498.1 asparaginase [Paenibacillus macerans]
METVLVNEYRGGLLECTHFGHICIVNGRGEVVKRAGNPHQLIFTRSAAKPIQAIPGIRAGIVEAFGLGDAEVAIMAASHRAEAAHVGTLERLLDKTGLKEEALVCAPSLPLDEHARERVLRQGGNRRRLYHNCAGKHLGVLAYCKLKGYPLDGYNRPEHPVQKEILATLAELAGCAQDDISLGTDGCGFPVFALPLSALAAAYVKLARPELIDDPKTAKAAAFIASAMNRHPQLVAGSGRIDSILLADPNIVAKGGFKGVYAFALRKERLGVAFKVLDGSEEEWGLIVTAILEQLGYGNEETLRKLRSAFPSAIKNDEGWEVGHAETAFSLGNPV